jgi:hypothetical protein
LKNKLAGSYEKKHDVGDRKMTERLEEYVRGQGELISILDSGVFDPKGRFSPWRPTWTQIIPGKFGRGNFDHLLFYDKGNGELEICRINQQGSLAPLSPISNLGATWDLIVPGQFTPKNSAAERFDDLVLYDRSRGLGEICATDGQGSLTPLSPSTDWGDTWDLIVPGQFAPKSSAADEFTDLLFYDRSRGLGKICTTDGHGGLTPLSPSADWGDTWDLIVPGQFVPKDSAAKRFDDLLFYNSCRGVVEIYTTDGQGGLISYSRTINWGKDFDLVLPGQFLKDGSAGDEFTDLLFYTRKNGKAATYRLKGGQIPAKYIWEDFWRESWQLIVPGNFSGGKTTDLLCYDQSRVLISQADLKKKLEKELKGRFIPAFEPNLADKEYYCPRYDPDDTRPEYHDDIRRILSKSKLNQKRYVAEKLDCDDYAHLLKAEFIEDAYRHLKRRFPHACGILWGEALEGRDSDGNIVPIDHAINIVLTSNDELLFIEPQSDNVYPPRANDKRIYLIVI